MKPKTIEQQKVEYAEKPRPVKLEAEDDDFLVRESFNSPFSVSDFLRAGVKLLRKQHKRTGDWAFLLELQ